MLQSPTNSQSHPISHYDWVQSSISYFPLLNPIFLWVNDSQDSQLSYYNEGSKWINELMGEWSWNEITIFFKQECNETRDHHDIPIIIIIIRIISGY